MDATPAWSRIARLAFVALLPASLLVDNPINRYQLNSPMLPDFKRDPDGGITFYLQNERQP